MCSYSEAYRKKNLSGGGGGGMGCDRRGFVPREPPLFDLKMKQTIIIIKMNDSKKQTN